MSKPRDQRLYRGLAASVVFLGFCAGQAVRAEVFEFSAAGDWTVHDRPEITTTAGATPIATPHRQPPRTARTAPNRSDLASAASKAEISPDLVEAVAWKESRFRADAISRAGAIGEMQLMPATARDLGVDPFVSSQNLGGGATYLSTLLRRYNGDVIRALAAYNAGPGAVDRFGGVPPYKETQDYVAAVLDRLSETAARAPER